MFECFICFIHLRPVSPSGIGADSLHLSFLFCIKKHNANRRQNWLFISAPSEVVTGIITEEKLQGLFQWHFSCCSREDKRLKVFLTYLQSKDASVHYSGYFQVDSSLPFPELRREQSVLGLPVALSPPGHQFKQDWSFFWLGCPLPGRLKSHLPFALPIYFLWPPSLLFCPSHTRCGLEPSRSLMPSWFLLKLYRIGSSFWAAPDLGQLPQHWDGAAQDKQQLLGFMWSQANWVRQRSSRAAVRAEQGCRVWAQNWMAPELSASELLCSNFSIQECISSQHRDKNLCQVAQNAKAACSKFNKTFNLPPRKQNTKKKTFKRLLTENLENKEQEQKATIAQLLCLDGVVWNNVVLLPSNMELIAGLVTTSFIFVIIW